MAFKLFRNTEKVVPSEFNYEQTNKDIINSEKSRVAKLKKDLEKKREKENSSLIIRNHLQGKYYNANNLYIATEMRINESCRMMGDPSKIDILAKERDQLRRHKDLLYTQLSEANLAYNAILSECKTLEEQIKMADDVLKAKLREVRDRQNGIK